MKQMYVYMLLCSDGSYYTGVTNDLDRRFSEHQEGENKNAYTFRRRPVELVFSEDFGDPNIAIEYEKKLKSWSKLKKEALIKGKYESLPKLSKKEFP